MEGFFISGTAKLFLPVLFKAGHRQFLFEDMGV